MHCQQCQSYAVMPKSKSCLNCGFRNVQVGEDHAKQALPQQSYDSKYLNKLHKIRLLAKKGQVDKALQFCHRLHTKDHAMSIKQMMLEVYLWQMKKKPMKALQVMLKLKSKLPFNKKNLAYYYSLACLLQEQAQYKQAMQEFKKFIDHRWEGFRVDIQQRYQQLTQTHKRRELSVIEGGIGRYAHH